MQDFLERLGEVERVNTKLKKKDEDKFTFTKKGCENQFKFNNKVKDIVIDRMKVELQKHFKTLPLKIDELIKEGEKEIDDRNHKLKIANDYGFKAVEEFAKEDLARNDEEEKKIKRFRKEKKEREEKARGYRGFRGGRSGFKSFGDGRQGYESRALADKSGNMFDFRGNTSSNRAGAWSHHEFALIFPTTQQSSAFSMSPRTSPIAASGATNVKKSHQIYPPV